MNLNNRGQSDMLVSKGFEFMAAIESLSLPPGQPRCRTGLPIHGSMNSSTPVKRRTNVLISSAVHIYNNLEHKCLPQHFERRYTTNTKTSYLDH